MSDTWIKQIKEWGHEMDFYVPGRCIEVCDKMQNMQYYLSEQYGNIDKSQFELTIICGSEEWKTYILSPLEMLQKGIMGGKYMSDCYREFPKDWYLNNLDKFSLERKKAEINYFKINCSLSLKEWTDRQWIIGEDCRGWIQWYMRYYLGRRTEYDAKQIRRWFMFRRHAYQLVWNSFKWGKIYDITYRAKQRQSLLHWGYDGEIDKLIYERFCRHIDMNRLKISFHSGIIYLDAEYN